MDDARPRASPSQAPTQRSAPFCGLGCSLTSHPDSLSIHPVASLGILRNVRILLRPAVPHDVLGGGIRRSVPLSEGHPPSVPLSVRDSESARGRVGPSLRLCRLPHTHTHLPLLRPAGPACLPAALPLGHGTRPAHVGSSRTAHIGSSRTLARALNFRRSQHPASPGCPPPSCRKKGHCNRDACPCEQEGCDRVCLRPRMAKEYR